MTRELLRIESAQNRQVKELASLGKRKAREASGTFLLEGVRAVMEAVEAGADIRRLVVEDSRAHEDAIALLAEECLEKGTIVLEMPRALVKKISAMDTPQGIAAEVARPANVKLKDAHFGGAALLACEVRDPRNAGLMVRTAAAAGASPIIFSAGSVDPFHPLAVQTAMGTVFRVEVISGVTVADSVAAAREAGLKIVATSVSGGTPAAEWLRGGPEKFLLVMGGEADGLDGAALDLADTSVTLPLNNEVESLNVAVSAGVLLYAAALRTE